MALFLERVSLFLDHEFVIDFLRLTQSRGTLRLNK